MPHAMLAQDFFSIKGDIVVEEGYSPNIENFVISRLDDPTPIPIKFGSSYHKWLRLNEYANSTILYSFDFEVSDKVYSLDSFSLEVPAGLQNENSLRKNFRFYSPPSFVRVLTEFIQSISQDDNCNDFALAASRLDEITGDGLDAGIWEHNSFYRTATASSLVTFELLNHSCNQAKVVPALSALNRIAANEALHVLSEDEKYLLGKEISFAISHAGGDQPFYRSVNATGASVVGKILQSIGHGRVSSRRVAELHYAHLVILTESGDNEMALDLIRRSIPLLDEFRRIKGQFLYEFFLIISDSQLSSDGRSVAIQGTVPSDGFFADLPSSEVRDWCILLKELERDTVIESLWERDKSHASLRREMNALRGIIEEGEIECAQQ